MKRTSGPQELAPGQHADLTVTFPIYAGARSTVLRIPTDDVESPLEVVITARGTGMLFTSPASTWAAVGRSYRFTPVLLSIAPGPVVLSAVSMPAWMRFDGTVLEGTPPGGQMGTVPQVILRATNGHGDTEDLVFAVFTGGITQFLRLRDKRYFVEFATRAGHRYHIEYSDDLVIWKPSPLTVQAMSAKSSWIDMGAPATESSPASESRRFYRLLELPPAP